MKAIQTYISGNHCYGCGPENKNGLNLKSYWQGRGVATAFFVPQPFHNAGPEHFLNGGIISTLLDCHGVCTAWADAYDRAGRALGSGQLMWYATGQLCVDFLKPTPITGNIALVARVGEVTAKKTTVSAELSADGEVCAVAQIIAVRVPDQWLEKPPQ